MENSNHLNNRIHDCTVPAKLTKIEQMVKDQRSLIRDMLIKAGVDLLELKELMYEIDILACYEKCRVAGNEDGYNRVARQWAGSMLLEDCREDLIK